MKKTEEKNLKNAIAHYGLNKKDYKLFIDVCNFFDLRVTVTIFQYFNTEQKEQYIRLRISSYSKDWYFDCKKLAEKSIFEIVHELLDLSLLYLQQTLKSYV